MARCMMIPFEQLREWRKQAERNEFQPIPVWLECKERRDENGRKIIATAIDDIDGHGFMTPDAYMQCGASLELGSYNKTWRLWHAYGAEVPATESEPWELFWWERKGEGDVYQRNGYADRDDYLHNMAKKYGVPEDEVRTLAEELGAEEDFIELVHRLEDIMLFGHCYEFDEEDDWI